VIINLLNGEVTASKSPKDSCDDANEQLTPLTFAEGEGTEKDYEEAHEILIEEVESGELI
jgi:hypothetical protein